ncbi:MAG TPA: hypothetical protein VET30_11070, partial [Pseudoxanthomonas sp.]|nr:hypothetical protein [Pseudoxanthomonas sp.]
YVPCARLLFMVWSACVTLPAFAQRPPATIPTDRQALLERLPEGYAALAPSRLPSTPARSLAQAQMLLNTSARTGDSRLAARADALLAAFPATDRPPALLYARAFSAQHHHDFLGALVLLDSLIQDNPRDGNARLSRSQVRLVLGRLDQAREDCTALLGIDISDGLLCAASLSLRRGEYTTAGSLVERWLASTIPADGRRRYALVLRAEIAARAGDGDADAWFLRALALDRRDVRTLAAYARYLRGVGRNREVEILLSQDTVSDGLQLQRALASHRVDSARARKLIEAQGARYALAHAVGSEPEMRDEAEFLLTLRRQPDAALVLALKNFESQRDHEDVEILRRAAAAAGRNDVLASLQKWADSQHLKLPPLRVQATP